MKDLIQHITIAFLSISFFIPSNIQAQAIQELSLEQAINLALANHQQLKVSAEAIKISKQQTEIAKLQRLPNIAAAASAAYISDAVILDKDFSKVSTLPIPHFGNSYGVQASQLLYKGGLIKKSIELAGIREQLASLDLVKDQQAIKFLVISNYLDISKLLNQKKVYENNKILAQQRQDNITKYYNQGLVTRNELIRSELTLQQIDQAILVTTNSVDILNHNLGVALGLPADVVIKPTQDIANRTVVEDKMHYVQLAYAENPALRAANKNIELAAKNTELIRTDKYPALSAVGGYNMQRPITNVRPAMDMYSNTWQVGVSLSYSIDNLYKSKKRIKLGELQQSQATEALQLWQENVEMSVNAAYVKYKESLQNANIFLKSQGLAQENYKIIEAKYLNQLAIQAEMTDATNAKLEAELQYVNAEINIIYQYYNLIKATGTL